MLILFFILDTASEGISPEESSLSEVIGSLQDNAFNCSSEAQWDSMVSLIAEKSSYFSSAELKLYAQCVSSSRHSCVQKLSNGNYQTHLITRQCHKWPDMKFLGNGDADSAKGGFFALASYPGSGNTWVRLLLEELTGVFTGSVYCDASLLFSGMLGAFVVSSRVLVVKTHHGYLSSAKGVVVIVRNPFHALISSLTYKETRSHDRHVTYSNFTDDQVRKLLNGWQVVLDKWLLKSAIPSHVVSYDSLLVNFEQEIRGLLSFINFPVSEETINCVVKNGEKMATFKRQRYAMQGSPYSTQQKSMIDAVIQHYVSLWRKHKVNYKLWKW